jgi:hypothetical protein
MGTAAEVAACMDFVVETQLVSMPLLPLLMTQMRLLLLLVDCSERVRNVLEGSSSLESSDMVLESSDMALIVVGGTV